MEALYLQGKMNFIEAIKYGCDSDKYKEYEQTHDFMRLAGDFLYSALSYVINNAPAEGEIVFYTDDEWASRAKVQRILRDMRGMMPVGFYGRIRVLKNAS